MTEQGTFSREISNTFQTVGKNLSPELLRVQERAKANKEEQFRSLAHYLTVDCLRRAYRRLNKKSKTGIDGISKTDYGENLEENLKALHKRLKEMQYKASPVRRIYLKKEDGSKRPIGIPTTEDKIVQGAIVEILSAVYEVDFHGFSYGFRPGKSQHKALQALQTLLQKGKVNWVIDADLSKFFDSIDHKELMSVIKRRVIDGRILRIIGRILSAGAVEEDGRRIRSKQGTPQGGIISPLLANIFLNTVLDDYIHIWRKTEAVGEVYIVRYADDFVIATENRNDADKLMGDLKRRFETYGLKLHPEKTKLIRFGRSWLNERKGNKPGTFNFLGFTHISGRDRKGRYLVKRKTRKERLNKSIKLSYEKLKEMMHLPIEVQHRFLKRRLTGHYNYFGVRGNFDQLKQYHFAIWKMWYGVLKERSQKRFKFRKYELLLERFPLPRPKITHSEGWLPVNPGYLLGRAGCGKSARPVL